MLNLLSLMKIQNRVKNGKLTYFDYFEILVGITSELLKEGWLPEENFVNYANYLEYKRTETSISPKRVLPNTSIEDNLNIYGNMTRKGEARGFHKIYKEVQGQYETYKRTYLESIEISLENGTNYRNFGIGLLQLLVM